jgi:hypothetical protein
MKTNVLKIVILMLFLLSYSSYAQESKTTAAVATNTNIIEGLNFYPNPVSNGKIYVTSKSGLDKEVVIFDVLGKLVLQTTITTKELNISALSPGVYIIKFKEGEATTTRKLIIK